MEKITLTRYVVPFGGADLAMDVTLSGTIDMEADFYAELTRSDLSELIECLQQVYDETYADAA